MIVFKCDLCEKTITELPLKDAIPIIANKLTKTNEVEDIIEVFPVLCTNCSSSSINERTLQYQTFH